MDFVRSYFDTNEPLTSWTLLSSLFSRSVLKAKGFNWPEVHLYPSNFLQNPYFSWHPDYTDLVVSHCRQRIEKIVSLVLKRIVNFSISFVSKVSSSILSWFVFKQRFAQSSVETIWWFVFSADFQSNLSWHQLNVVQQNCVKWRSRNTFKDEECTLPPYWLKMGKFNI